MKKKAATKSAQPSVSVEETRLDVASSDEKRRESASANGGTVPEDGLGLEPVPLPKNRAAFLFGFCAQLPSVDAIVEPMLAVCDSLSSNKIMLLDNCLSRIAAYDVELAGVPQIDDDYRWHLYSNDEKHRLHNLLHQRRFEVIKLRATSASLWTGRSELRSWYLAGVALGELLVHLEESRAAVSRDADLDNRVLDRACETFRKAARWRGDSTSIREACDAILEIPAKQLDEHGRLKLYDSGFDLSLRISDSQSNRPAIVEQAKFDRDQFIYEHVMVHGEVGKAALAAVNVARQRQSWPDVTDPERIIVIARQFANRNNKPLPSERAGGRKPDAEE